MFKKGVFMKILLVGALGRMGKIIIENYSQQIIAGVDLKSEKVQIPIFSNFANIPKKTINDIDVVLDFSSPSVLEDEIKFCIQNNKPLVICATAHSNTQKKLIKCASKKIPVFVTNNTSLGVFLLDRIIDSVSKQLVKYDIGIIDIHHKNKKDVPSGTSKHIIDVLNKYGVKPDIVSLRGGTEVGEHRIILMGENEKIEVSHTASDRRLFASGAIGICEYMNNNKVKKLYTMNDLIK